MHSMSQYPHPLTQGDCCGWILQLGLGLGDALTSPHLGSRLASSARRDFFLSLAPSEGAVAPSWVFILRGPICPRMAQAAQASPNAGPPFILRQPL